MEIFLAKYWPILMGAAIAIASLWEKIFKVKKDGVDTKISTITLLERDIKALQDRAERQEKDHKEDMRLREKDWREALDKKDTEHRTASAQNTKMIADLETKIAVYQSENKAKDGRIKELQAFIENRNPQLEALLGEVSKGLKDIFQFMQLNVRPISEIK